LDLAKAETGATTTKGGVVVVPLAKGSGMFPTAASSVEVHYTGMLADGTGRLLSLARLGGHLLKVPPWSQLLV